MTASCSAKIAMTKRKAPEELEKRGRPTEYDPAYCEQVVEHGKLGKSFETFAIKVGVHRTTLYDWCERHPDFAYARKVSAEARADWWEELITQGAAGLLPNFSAAATIFALKQQGWKDKQELELSGRDGEAIKVQAVRDTVMGFLQDPQTAAALETLANAGELPAKSESQQLSIEQVIEAKRS